MEARSFPTEIAEANAEFTENRIVKRIKVEGNASIQKEPEEKKIQKKKEQKLKKKFNRTQKPIRAGFQEVSPAKFLNPCKLYRYYSVSYMDLISFIELSLTRISLFTRKISRFTCALISTTSSKCLVKSP